MYFLLIRPQQKRAKDHKNLLKELKKGDEVVTNGGILGKINSVDESFATLEIAEGVVVKVQKQGINQKMPKGSAKL
jgi:preprotein translocase subunit YajC